MKTLSADEIEKAGLRLRTTQGAPAIPRAPDPEPEKPDPLLPMIERLTASMDSMRAALKELKPQNNGAALSAILHALEQNGDVLQTIKDVMEISAHEEQEEEPQQEEWECTPEHDDYGRIKRVRVKRL